MKSKFTGHGGWPTPKAGPRVTNADIRAAHDECPKVFQTELEATDAFLTFLPIGQEMGLGFEIKPGMSAEDIRVASFRAMQRLEQEIFGDPNAVPVPEIIDE